MRPDVDGRSCKPQLRTLLNYHCGVATLRTRQMMMRPASPMSLPTATALSVNLNKVALVRNTRHLGIPSVLFARRRCAWTPARTASRCIRGPTSATSAPQDVHDLSALLARTGPGPSSTSRAIPSTT